MARSLLYSSSSLLWSRYFSLTFTHWAIRHFRPLESRVRHWKGFWKSSYILKVFFEVPQRLGCFHFGVIIAGILDIQLMELAILTLNPRSYSRRCVSGLTKCIEKDLYLSPAEIKAWKAIKGKGLNLFTPERGGSFEVFNTRPLLDGVQLYCIQDVQFILKL